MVLRKIDEHRPRASLRVPDLDSTLLSGNRRDTLFTLVHKALILILTLSHAELERDVLQALLNYIHSLRLLLRCQIVPLIKVKLRR